jgi:ribonuclease Z
MIRVQVLGTSSATPTESRHLSGQVISYHDRHYLVDCGEGTQRQFLRYHIRTARLDAIFITHLHGDHIFGLPGLLTSLSLGGRTAAIRLFAPAGLKPMLDAILEHSQSYLTYPLEFTALEDFAPGEVIFETRTLRVTTLELNHRIFCRGFIFEEINKRPRISPEAIEHFQIPRESLSLMKNGNPITLPDGRVLDPTPFLLPPEPPVSYAYCSDTRYLPDLGERLKGITGMYHEATYVHDHVAKAEATMHSTAREAAMTARDAQAKFLLLGHFSARYSDLYPLYEEASAVFPGTELAVEGQIYEVK